MFDRVYGVYDTKGEVVLGPLLFFPNDPAACRMFSDLVHARDTEVAKYPADYVLVRFGAMQRDELLGLRIVAEDGPTLRPVLSGQDVLDADAAAEVQRRRVLNQDVPESVGEV